MTIQELLQNIFSECVEGQGVLPVQMLLEISNHIAAQSVQRDIILLGAN